MSLQAVLIIGTVKHPFFQKSDAGEINLFHIKNIFDFHWGMSNSY